MAIQCETCSDSGRNSERDKREEEEEEAKEEGGKKKRHDAASLRLFALRQVSKR